MSNKYFCCFALCLLYFVFKGNASDETEVMVSFDAELYSSEHFNVSHCRARKPYYKYVKGMNITVEIYYKSDFNITALDYCVFGTTKMLNKNWTAQRNGDLQHIKISLPNIQTHYYHPTLVCFIKLDSNPSSELRCESVFWTRDDDYKYFTIASHSGYVEARVSADLNEPYVGHELLLHRNSTLMLECKAAAEKAYKHLMIKKDHFGKTIVVSRDPIETVFVIDEYTINSTSEFGCMETHKFNETNTHQATLRVKYDEDKPGKADKDEYNSNNIGWIKIVLITSGCFVAVVLLVTALCIFYRRGKSKRIKDHNDSRDSGVYEEIGDVLPENNARREDTHSSLSPSPPSPPPPHSLFSPTAESVTNGLNQNDTKSPAPYAPGVSQGSFISPADLHLLAIDSYGYEIVEPKFQQLGQHSS